MRNWMAAGSAAALVAVGPARAVGRTDAGAAQVDLEVADDVGSVPGIFAGADYGTSERFGRAWVVLHYTVESSCPAADGVCEEDAPVAVSVPGLAYDAAAGRVLYRAEGEEPVVCASVRHRGFPWLGDSLQPTGACTVRVEKVDRFVDDGFAGRRDRRDEVHFAVRRSEAVPAPGAVAGASR